jgi:hypothetical protein
MDREFEKLIEAIVADGKVADKERDVLYKAADRLGIDRDTADVMLDAALHAAQSKSETDSAREGKSRNCPTCGATNETFVLNCAYCGAVLDASSKFDEGVTQLIQSCSSFLAKYEALVEDYVGYNSAKQIDQYRNDPIFGSLANSKKKGDSLLDIKSEISRNLDLLETVAKKSSAVRPVLAELKSRHENAKSREKSIGSPGRIFSQYRLFFVAFGLFFALMIPFFVNMERKSTAGANAENARLEAIVEKVDQSIASGDLSAARYFCSQIVWKYDDDYTSFDEQALGWEETRKTMLEAIENIEQKK